MTYRLNFRDVLAESDHLLDGIAVTLALSASTMAAGLVIGVLGAVAQVYGGRLLRGLAAAYVELIRNTPLIVQLFIVFFGLPGVGMRLDAMTAALITLAVNCGAYATEIIRAGIEAIPRTQLEAGRSLGLSEPQLFRHVVLFPALKIIYPALASQFVLLMLATSIVSQISAPDLFHVASIIQSRTFRDFEVYLLVAVVYLALALAFRLVFAGIHRLAFGRP